MVQLEVVNLTKRFGGLVANDNISLQVKEGEILGLIGPNGAGKTTFFNCISGFYQPDGGSVYFDGREITRLSASQICHVGIARTFQVVKTFKDMTVLENVMVGALCRTWSVNQAREQALEVLDFTGLAAQQNAGAGSLTIADRKRLEVARALATQPKILLLDEALSGLNPVETQEAVQLIKKIQSRGITLIVVEHVMEVIMSLSDRIVVLDYGKKIAEGLPEQIAVHEEVIRAYLGERYYAQRQ